MKWHFGWRLSVLQEVLPNNLGARGKLSGPELSSGIGAESRVHIRSDHPPGKHFEQ